MNVQTVSIDFPNDILLAINESESELKKRIKLLLAIQLYVSEKLTIGKAAQLSGLSRLEFEKELSKNKISISKLYEVDIISDFLKLKV
jgi:predicted HTH domain antitoxin